MCVFNGEQYLHEAVASILGQTFTNFEFVIVDDGSGPVAKEVLSSYDDRRIRLVTNPVNLGLTRSLNIGLAACQGEYVARMDADDVSHPERLEKQVAFLDEHRDVAVLGTQVHFIGENGTRIRSSASRKGTSPLTTRWQSLFDSPVVHSSVMFRRDVIVDECGGYDERFVTSQDFLLWSCVMGRHQISNLGEELVDFRCHAESVSQNYQPDHICKIGEIFQLNLGASIGPDQLIEDFGSNWVTITNPDTLPPLRDTEHVLRQLDYIYHAFKRQFSVALGSETDREIREHLADKYYLVCYNVSDHDRKSALACVRHYCTYTRYKLSLKMLALLGMAIVGRRRLQKLRNAR